MYLTGRVRKFLPKHWRRYTFCSVAACNVYVYVLYMFLYVCKFRKGGNWVLGRSWLSVLSDFVSMFIRYRVVQYCVVRYPQWAISYQAIWSDIITVGKAREVVAIKYIISVSIVLCTWCGFTFNSHLYWHLSEMQSLSRSLHYPFISYATSFSSSSLKRADFKASNALIFSIDESNVR